MGFALQRDQSAHPRESLAKETQRENRPDLARGNQLWLPTWQKQAFNKTPKPLHAVQPKINSPIFFSRPTPSVYL
jgi:hypothetical protein